MVTPLQEVKYSAIRGIVPASALNSLSDHKGVDLAEIFFFTKNEHWSYEEELRMVANPNTADKIVEVKGGFNLHLFKFPSESLREIVFGYQMSRELRLNITNVVADKYPDVELFEAKLSETEFDLDIRAVTDRRSQAVSS